MEQTMTKLKYLKPGVVFDAGIVEVEILEHFDNGRTLLVTKKTIGNRPFTVRPFTYNRTDPEPNPNNFAYSSLCYDLNTDFLESLSDAGVILADNVIKTGWSLADHDGTNRYSVAVCKVAMLTEPMIRKYYDAGLLTIDDWEWTITPYAGNANHVRYVYSGGSLGNYSARLGHGGVRPAFFVDSNLEVPVDESNMNYLSTEELIEQLTSKDNVVSILVGPHDVHNLTITGPARILIVPDENSI